jgi:signal transduction histidine kinase
VGAVDAARSLARRIRQGDPLVVDTAIAVALAAVTLIEIGLSRGGVSTADSAWSAAFMLAETLPLAFRRRYPFTVMLIVAVAAISYDLLSIPPDPNTAILPQLVALYSASAYARPRLAVAAAAITLTALVGLNLPGMADRENFASFANEFGLFAGAWVVGQNMRYRRREAALLRERAERSERDQWERARIAALEERGRLAREIHDVIAHSVSVIAVQAGAARAVAQQRPDLAREALGAIEDVSKETLTEVRRAIGALRDAGDAQPDGPAPGLADLDALVERVRGTGVDVDISVMGTRRDLGSAVESSAYRIVQEALTNTVKHAGRTVAHVQVTFDRDGVEVAVRDEGFSGPRSRSQASNGGDTEGGQGLIGLRERVAILGGTFHAGPNGAGFEVRARLPVDSPTEHR